MRLRLFYWLREHAPRRFRSAFTVTSYIVSTVVVVRYHVFGFTVYQEEL